MTRVTRRRYRGAGTRDVERRRRVAQGREAVAVIVPNHNKEPVLRACLESIYAQSYPPAEVIVVDDASTDQSRRIVAEFPATLLALPVNRGPAAARNAGVAASTAPLLFFLDSDTALAPDALATAVRLLHEHRGCGLVQGVYDPEPLVGDGPVEAYRIAYEHYWRSRTTATLFSCTLLTREAFAATGGFDERLRDGEDLEFGSRLPTRYRRVVTDRVRCRADDVDRFWPWLWEGFVRASTLPLIRLQPRRGGGAQVPVPGHRMRWRDRVSLASTGLLLAGMPAALLWPQLAPALPLLVATLLVAHRGFLALTYRLRGPGFAFFAAGMHVVSHVVFGLGVGAGLLRWGYQRSSQWWRGLEESARRRLWRLLAAGFVVLLAGALTVALLGQDWSVVTALTAAHEPGGIALLFGGAVLANAVGLSFGLLSFRAVLRDLAPPVGLARIARIFFIGFLAKYVPGKVVGIIASIRVAQASGVSIGQLLSASLLNMCLVVLTGLSLGLLAAGQLLGPQGLWLVLPAALTALVLVRPQLVGRGAQLLGRLVRRPVPAAAASAAGIRAAAAWQSVSWLVSGLHLWLLAVAMGAPPLPSLALCLGAFSLATALGVMAIVLPDGIGVREAVLIGALAVVLPLPAAAVVALASRLVCTVSEVALGGTALAAAEIAHRRSPAPEPIEKDRNGAPHVPTDQYRRVRAAGDRAGARPLP